MSKHSSEFEVESSSNVPVTSRVSTLHGRRLLAHEAAAATATDGVAALESILRTDDPATALEAWRERPAAASYREFADQVRDELAPAGALEEMLVDRVILSAWRMRTALRAEEIWTIHEATGQHLLIAERVQCKPLEDLRRDSQAAERGFRRAIDNLETHRSRRAPQWGKATKTDPREAPRIAFEPEPTPHRSSTSEKSRWSTDLSASPAATLEESPRWQDRLVYDYKISESSPVVKGTWVTVSHLVSLIVDGWTWADILRAHPELTEEDIRTCVAFACEGEGMEV
ncbi:MAG: DUF433 domain-containing protein [Isosphaeraceae bacterium]|nr:DUF433 domain-containing protein [Isosphaeraceae bacterium]